MTTPDKSDALGQDSVFKAAEGYSDLIPAKDETEASYESYVGVCDVLSPEAAHVMADTIREHRKDPNRKVMIGVMAGHFTMRPEAEYGEGQRAVFPRKEELANGFIDDPDVFNTIHFADLYRPKEVQTLFEDLELVVDAGGEYLHAIQLDVTWPDIDDIDRFKDKYPDIAVVLQLGKSAFEMVDHEPQKMVDELDKYGDSIDYVLLDLSMGKGKAMEADALLASLRLIRQELPGLGLAVAGGLGPDSIHLLEPVAREFPDVSIDAQGRLKHADAPVDENGHMVSTIDADPERADRYISGACKILDNPKEEA
jgi:hypothetical protein